VTLPQSSGQFWRVSPHAASHRPSPQRLPGPHEVQSIGQLWAVSPQPESQRPSPHTHELWQSTGQLLAFSPQLAWHLPSPQRHELPPPSPMPPWPWLPPPPPSVSDERPQPSANSEKTTTHQARKEVGRRSMLTTLTAIVPRDGTDKKKGCARQHRSEKNSHRGYARPHRNLARRVALG
jgi:hypothetical protein